MSLNTMVEYEVAEKRGAEEILEQHAGLVSRIANHLLCRLPASVQQDDLIQAGLIGLLEAWKKYDATKGASFETFASIRVRGAMLDEVRRGDWQPRSVHRNSRRVSEAVREIENKTGRDAKDTDIAEVLGVNIEEYYKLLRDLSGGQILSFEDAGLTDDSMRTGGSVGLETPLDALQDEDFKQYLGKAIKELPEREGLVLSLYYDEELNLKEIGQILGVSESRVCQIHAQAMTRLNARMNDWR